MKKLIDYINSNVLYKVASLNSAAVITRILSGFLTSKAIAYFIGAEGMALVGNLRDFLRFAQSFSILGLYNGVVKYIAEFKDNTKELSKTISTVFYLGFISSFIISLLCYFYAQEINDYLFPGYNDYAFVIRILAVAMPFYALNMFSFSILNGFSKYRILLVINIIGQLLGTFVTVFLIWLNKLDGALVAVVIAESLIFLITVVGIANQRSLVGLIQVKNVRLASIKKLSTYSIMALFSAIVLPLVSIEIRSYIIDNVNQQAAGFWELMTRISKYYLMFVSSLLTLYILPRLSEIDNVKEFRKEVFSFYKTIIPVFAGILIVIYVSRSLLISILFTEDFRPVEDLFGYQILGDFMRVLSMVIAYQF